MTEGELKQGFILVTVERLLRQINTYAFETDYQKGIGLASLYVAIDAMRNAEYHGITDFDFQVFDDDHIGKEVFDIIASAAEHFAIRIKKEEN